jgi:hypothetical protein
VLLLAAGLVIVSLWCSEQKEYSSGRGDTVQQVEIRVEGQIDEQWSDWLGNLTITHVGQDQTMLTGKVIDQAWLYGILSKLRDLGLKLVLVSVDA